jgi:ABC-2 type transport system permease protein
VARLALILGLRLRLTYRYFTGNKGRLIGFIAGALVSLTLAMFMTYAVLACYRELDHAHDRRLFELTLLLGTLMVITGPLMGFRSNEFLDISKLFLFPVRPSIVFTAQVLGSWFSGTSLFLMPLLILPLCVATDGRTEILIRVGLSLLFLFHLYAVAQCLTLALLNVLRSRWFRDLVAVVTSLLGLLMYLGLQMLARSDGRDLRHILDSIPVDVLRPWLPPLWASAAIFGEGVQRWLWAVPLVVVTVAVSHLSLHLTRRAFYGELALDVQTRGVRERPGLLRSILLRILPVEAGAIYEKELITLRREPWLRTLFIQQLGFVVMVVLAQMFAPTQRPGGLRDFDPTSSVILMAGLVLLYIETSFVSNILSLEGPGILHLFILPARRLRILLGKNVAHYHVLLLLNSLLIPGIAGIPMFLQRGIEYPWRTVLLLVALNAAALPVVIGTGALVSVYFPQGVAARGRRVLTQDQTGGDGCFTAMFRSLLSMAMTIPLAILFVIIWVVPTLVIRDARVHWITVPSGIACGAAIYVVLLAIAARGLEHREPRILEELMKGGK